MNDSWGCAHCLSWCRNPVVHIQNLAMPSPGDGLVKKIQTTEEAVNPLNQCRSCHMCNSRKSGVGSGFPIDVNECVTCESHRYSFYIKEKDKYFAFDKTEWVGLLLVICLFRPTIFYFTAEKSCAWVLTAGLPIHGYEYSLATSKLANWAELGQTPEHRPYTAHEEVLC